MRAFEIQEFGIDQLKIAEHDMPQPGYAEVLVRMTAASLNYRDLMVAKGLYNPKLRRPMVPLSDGAGVVEEVGTGVTRFRKGDRVIPIFMQSWIDGPPDKAHSASALGGSIDGVLREFALFSEHGLVPTPSSLSDLEAATLPCAAVTAWHAMFEGAPAIPGETVLLQGTGGVSVFALQFAKAAGMRIIVTSSSGEKIERCLALGAHDGINYKATPDWDKEALKLTNDVGVDRIIEVGGSDTLPRSLRAIGTHGVIAVIGVLSGRETSVNLGPILMNSVRLQGIYVGSRAMFERMIRAISLNAIKPVVYKTFPWTEFPDALRYMESQQHFGKICLTF